MAGFGKKNAKELNIRALMIHAAAEIFAQEKDVKRLLTRTEIEKIVKLVFSSHEHNPTPGEISYALAGTNRLVLGSRDYIETIVTRWRRGNVSLNKEDFDKVEEIFGNSLESYANHWLPVGEPLNSGS
jgi:hypothetical protein